MQPVHPLPPTFVAWAVLLIAPLALPPPAAGAADAARMTAPAATGQWTLAPLREPGVFSLTLSLARRNDHHDWGFERVSAAECVGLPPGRDDGRVAFDLKREAGSVHAEGVLVAGRGSGTFELSLDPAYADSLQRRGVGRPNAAQQIALALADAHVVVLDEFRALGYATPRIESFVRCADHRVDRSYVQEMVALGYKLASIDEWVKARDHGVDPAFVRGMSEIGYKGLTFAQVLRARDHGADPAYAAEMRAAGFGMQSLDDLIATRDHGVDARYAGELAEFGYKGLSLAKLIELRDHGVDAHFLSGLRQAGFVGVTPQAAIEARSHGVDGAYLSGLLDAGYSGFTLEDAARARDHGVDAGFAADTRRRLGRTPSLDELIRLRDTANPGN